MDDKKRVVVIKESPEPFKNLDEAISIIANSSSPPTFDMPNRAARRGNKDKGRRKYR